ncbi:chorismate mutase [Acuticoccus sp. M5D2P5]|uniref:chorismate mutase n=1 Tax=Acuticoccus kalidii TaxID=2910977 RepID=UPI001F3AFB66|nr:chorismate mutase [Acuticoccus kalidii]MCF3932787.1 chorismate mutase [Acuticoccus kalidii]
MVTPLSRDSSDSLSALRDRLDLVDTGLHRLLRERFEIVSEIGAAKGPDESVIRPAREAAVIENRLSLHTGTLPHATLVHIWRVLIGAACVAQRPFRVHVAGPLDVARYLYGPVEMTLASPAEAVAALADAPGDIAVIDGATGDRWWSARNAAHVIGRYRQSDDGVAVVLGGAGVSRGTGPLALVLRDEAPVEVSAGEIGPEDDVLGLYHPFPFPVPVAQPLTSSPK